MVKTNKVTIIIASVVLVALMLFGVMPVMADTTKSLELPHYLSKSYPSLDFYGEVSRETMYFAFRADGTVEVWNKEKDRLILGGPLPGGFDLYQKGDIIWQDFNRVRVGYDFGSDDNTVHVIYEGNYTGRISVPFSGVGEAKEGLRSYSCGKLKYDWSDITDSATFDRETNTLIMDVTGEFLLDPSIVGTSTSYDAVSHSSQRKVFYAEGLFWVFYSDGSDGVYRTSADGETWSGSTTFRASVSTGYKFNTWYDGTYFSYAYFPDVNGASLDYRRGILVDDGTISWSAVEQEVVAADASYEYQFGSICTDSNGYPWIAYLKEGVADYSFVTKSSTNDGTWTTEGGFPYQLTTNNSNKQQPVVVPLTSGKVAVVYSLDGGVVSIQSWDGDSWNAEDTTTAIMDDYRSFGLVAIGDDVSLVFSQKTTYDIIHTVYSYLGNSFGSETVIFDGGSQLYPLLTKNGEDLYCFWVDVMDDHVYYLGYIEGSWDVDPIDYYTDPNGLFIGYRASSSYDGYGSYVVVVWVSDTDPDSVTFSYLDVTCATYPTVVSTPADDIGETSATLHGETTDLGGETWTTSRGFVWGTASVSDVTVDHNDPMAGYTNGSYTIGNNGLGVFEKVLDGTLDPDTTYYWRACATNSVGWSYSAERSFDTLQPLPSAPTDFTITQTGVDEVTLTWTNGTYAATTLIMVQEDSYPPTTTDGYLVYDGALETATFDGLDLTYGTYCFRAWSENATGFSADTADARTGGNMLLLGVMIFLALGLTISSIIFKRGYLAFSGAGVWVITSIYCWGMASENWDVYFSLGFLFLFFTLVSSFAPLSWRETTPENESPEESDSLLDGLRSEMEARDKDMGRWSFLNRAKRRPPRRR